MPSGSRKTAGKPHSGPRALEEAGLLTSGKEDIDPHAEGRPPRRHYTITGAAVTAVRIQLAALSEQYRPPVPTQAQLKPYGCIG